MGEKMKMSVVLKYLQAFSWRWMWLTIAAYVGQNALGIGQNLWLSTWTAETAQVSDFTEWKQSRNYKLSIYGLLGFIQGLLVCCGAYVLTRGSLSASRAMHGQLLDNVLHLPLQHFVTNPVGRIISRFTKVSRSGLCEEGLDLLHARHSWFLPTPSDPLQGMAESQSHI
ncbi:canalicular multispecific organic anion transporter 1-like [Pipra filicauda]|uniref:Canalicular multispecific organic anion transporter 1-like n=1 Tax=Pipra filicauda TaxID=649802 RepID=A0A7R5KRE4_9PASS|nr:canalicular multispecific organic anion transporter 1-like [Pipra filicauda]